jgi:AcrR family transcriptional regulator
MVYKVRFKVYKVHMSRDRIFAAAKAVLDREGLPGLTVRKVADHAGLSPMAMYRHFADKDALLNALMDDGLAAWEKIARAIRAADPLEWLTALGEAFLEFALTEPHRFDAAFFLPAPRARQYPDDFVAGRSPVVAMALVRIDEAKTKGYLGKTPALEVALAFSGLVQGLVSMYRANRFSSEKQFRALFRVQVGHCLAGFSNKIAGRSR